MRAGMPSARAIATYSAVCSLQSPTLVRSTSRADGRLTVGFLSSSALTCRVSRSARARSPSTLRTAALGLGDDLRASLSISGSGRKIARRHRDPPCQPSSDCGSRNLDDVAVHRLTGAVRCPVPIDHGAAEAQRSAGARRAARRSARLPVGTIAAALKQIVTDVERTPPASARRPGLPHGLKPSGLSSSTTSPVSVIHDVVFNPA